MENSDQGMSPRASPVGKSYTWQDHQRYLNVMPNGNFNSSPSPNNRSNHQYNPFISDMVARVDKVEPQDPPAKHGPKVRLEEPYQNEESIDEEDDDEPTGHIFKGRLLSSKFNREKFEENARALANRITLLENEEKKLLTKIEDTKRKALEVLQIKKAAKNHKEAVDNYKKHSEDYLVEKRVEIADMKYDLAERVKDAEKGSFKNS